MSARTYAYVLTVQTTGPNPVVHETAGILDLRPGTSRHGVHESLKDESAERLGVHAEDLHTLHWSLEPDSL